MCFLCEEPFRTLFIGLAAVGAVSLIRLGMKGLERLRLKDAATESAATESAQ